MRSYRFLCLIVSSIVFFALPTAAQNTVQFKKETIDSVLETFDHSTRLPGYSLAIVHKGEVIYTANRGKASIDENKKISPATLFNIGSVSKQFTGAAILLLEEAGKLSLNDDIHKYIPELPNYGHTITIQQLLNHTSGIRDHVELATLIAEDKDELNTFTEMLAWQNKYPSLNTAPGTSFAYSHTGYMMLAMIIERVSGTTYALYLLNNIFTPLGMANTYVEEGKNSVLRDGSTHYELNHTNSKAKKAEAYTNPLGASGIISTTEDLAKWDKNFLKNKLGKGSQQLITKMETSGTLNDGTDVHYGAGLLIKTYRFKNIAEHSGGQGEYLTLYRRFLDEDLSIIVCMNSYLISPFDICDAISNNIMSFKLQHWLVQKSLADSTLKSLEGTYGAENNLVRYVYREKGKLYIARIFDEDTSKFVLNYTGNTANGGYAFVDTLGSSVVFKVEGEKITGLSWDGGTYFVCNRFYTKENTTVPFNLYSFAGKYYCPELDKKVRIQYFSKKDELTIHPFLFIKYDLIHKGGSIYVVADQPYIVNFNKNEFTIGNDWVYNISYEKKVKPKKEKKEKNGIFGWMKKD
jgi:CubicO group peptidase (beta-lactamase class C family)